MPNQIRHNYPACSQSRADELIARIKGDSRFVCKKEIPAAENSHFVRYTFLCGAQKVSVVYDTIAKIFSITAAADCLAQILALLDTPAKSVQENKQPPKPQLQEIKNQPQSAKPQQPAQTVKQQPPQQQAAKPQSKPQPPTQEAAKAQQPPQQQQEKQLQAKAEVKAQQPQTQAKAAEKAPLKKQPQKTSARAPKFESKAGQPAQNTVQKAENKTQQKVSAQEPKAAAENTLPEYKNGFSLKKCAPERLEGVLKRIRSLKGVSTKVTETVAGGTKQETISYEITDSKKQKVVLRYMPKKLSLQMQGKRSDLFGELQVILSRDSGYTEAVASHIELTGEEKRAGEIQRNLKKLMPDAFPYLAEQSKIDLSIGMIDIGNPDVRLSDYSVLLVPPFRGLERFIYDLQTAQGISVKMIGQAYEKDDQGNYLLKLGYRKKIPGVIYAEVMSALYTEYFRQRNFYAHSDNSAQGGMQRIITDKSAAKQIFDHLCGVINYNCKKLKEIGFSL